MHTTEPKQLVGIGLTMSLLHNKTSELWKAFMPLRHSVPNVVNNHLLLSVGVYPPGYFETFDPARSFQKWAAVEVSNFTGVPEGLQTLTIPAGLYAVFHYTGSSSDSRIFQYIFGEWLPASGYVLDQRPHVELLGEKYKNNDPASEEDIWIPVQSK